MADFPYLPLFTDAYLADTRHLSRDEHGAYLLLMMEAWRRPRCSIPDNDVLLARITCSTDEEWKSIKATVMSFWTLDKRRREWTQKRLAKERVYVEGKRQSQRDKAAKRWNKAGKQHAVAMPDGMPEACPEHANPHPHPQPTPTKKSKCIASDPFEEWWSDCPRKIGKGQARRAFVAALRKTDGDSFMLDYAGYVEAERSRGQADSFIKHPATWLNGECWNDDEGDTSARRRDRGEVDIDMDEILRESGLVPNDRGTVVKFR